MSEEKTPKESMNESEKEEVKEATPEPAQESASPQNDLEKRPRRLPRWAKMLGWGLCGVMGTVVVAVGTFTAVPALQHKVVFWAVDQVDGLTLEALDGHLFSPVLHGIHYVAPGVDVKIAEASYKLDWRELPARLVKMKFLAVKGVEANIDTSVMPPSEPSTEPLGRIELPVGVLLEKGTIEAVSANVDGNQIALGSLNLNAKAAKSLAEVEGLTLDGLKVILAEASATPQKAPSSEEKASEKSPEKPQEKPQEKVGTTVSEVKAEAKTVETLVAELEALFSKPFLTAEMLPAGALSPIDVEVRQVMLKDVSLEVPGMKLPALTQLTLEGSLKEEKVRLPHLALQLSDKTTLLGSAKFDAKGDYPVAVHLWSKPGELLAEYIPGSIEPVSTMSSLSVNLDGELLGKLLVTLDGAGKYPLALKLEAEPSVAGLPFTLEGSAALLAFDENTPSLENLTISGGGRLVVPKKGGEAPADTKKSSESAPAPKNKVEASVATATDVAQDATPPGSVTDEGITLKVRGKLIPVKLPSMPALKPMSLALDAKATLTHLTLGNSGLQNSDGTAVLEADLDWAKKLTGKAGLALVTFNVAALAPAAPVKLGGEARVDFTSSTGDVLSTWKAALTKAKFTGELLEVTKNGEAKATGVKTAQNRADLDLTAKANAKGEWSARVNEFRWGENTLSMDGKGSLIGDTMSADALASLQLTKLSAFSPLLSGSLTGDVKVDGRFSSSVLEPVITADLKSHELKVLDANEALVAQIGDTTIKGTFGKKGAEPLTLQLTNLVVGSGEDEEQAPTRIEEAKLSLGGTIASHEVALDVKGEPVPAHLVVTGGLSKDFAQWKGNLAEVKIGSPIGDWGTKNVPILVNINQGSATVAAHCWEMSVEGKKTGTPNAVCLAEKAQIGEKGRTVVTLKHFALSTLAPILPQDVAFDGTFTGDATVAWDASKKGLPQVKVNLFNKGVNATRTTDSGPLTVKFNEVSLAANTQGEAISVKATVAPEHNGKLLADLSLSELNTNQKIGGTIVLEKWSLGALSQLFSTGEVVEGNLEANLKVGGRLGDPQLNGHLALTEASVREGLVPISIEPSDIVLLFKGQTSTLDGVVRTNEGEVALVGRADWSDLKAPTAEVRLRTRRDGKDETMGLTIPPYAELEMGADITAKASNAGVDISGEVVIPKGDITVNQLPDSAIQGSDDLVMLKRDLTPVTPKSAGMPIRSNLKITIGPRVRVNAFNLKARLLGELVMRQSKQGLGLNGSIQLKNGNFFAYGQALNITKGEILFSGPIDNPYVNLEAIRDPDATEDSVTAGLRVRGSATSPKVTIFSTPAMSNEKALSYLLRGQGLGSSSSDGQAVASALLGMGLSQTSGIVGSIGSAFGIQDLQVTSEGVGVKTKVVVKGNLFPRLQLKYGVGVFDSLATFTVRYRLLPRLYLQGVWDEDQTIDLLYRWQFN